MIPGNPGKPATELDNKKKDSKSLHPVTSNIKSIAEITDPVALAATGPELFHDSRAKSITGPELLLDDGLPPIIPTMNKTRHNTLSNATGPELIDNPTVQVENESQLAATKEANNLVLAGLQTDLYRGAGTASARRESPSYVTGMKSSGWDFDSEKKNRNTAGGSNTTFEDEEFVQRYQGVSTTGHQISMDDHPDFQAMRFRTSHGHQITMNDAADVPFIHIATGEGNVYMELQEDGNLHIFAEKTLSIHAKEDINLTADRNLNIDVQQDFRLNVRGNSELNMKGAVSIETGKNDLAPDGLNYSPNGSIGNSETGAFKMRNYGTVDWTVEKDFKQKVIGDSYYRFDKALFMTILEETDFLCIDNIRITSQDGKLDLTSGDQTRITSIENMEITGHKDILVQALDKDIHLNGPDTVDAEEADPAEEAEVPSLTPYSQVPISPTPDEIKRSATTQSIHNTLKGGVVPQHSPWQYLPKIAKPIAQRTEPNGEPGGDRGTTTIKSEESPKEGARKGATKLNSNTPIPRIEEDGVKNGQPFQTNDVAEEPQYDPPVRPARPGEFNLPDFYSSSEKLKNYIKKHEGKRNKAYPDASGYSIGYGHFIKVGEVINGDTINGVVTKEDIAMLRRTNGDLRISDAEIDRLFERDLKLFEASIKKSVTTKITQGQFDSLVAFNYSVGPGNLRKMIKSSNLNSGDFTNVPNTILKYHKCPGCPASQRKQIEGVLLGRRRMEIEEFWSNTDDPNTGFTKNPSA